MNFYICVIYIINAHNTFYLHKSFPWFVWVVLLLLPPSPSTSSLLQFGLLVGPGASASLLLSLVIALEALTNEDASKYVSFFWVSFFISLKLWPFSFYKPN